MWESIIPNFNYGFFYSLWNTHIWKGHLQRMSNKMSNFASTLGGCKRQKDKVTGGQ